jgi:hypothetical protein
MAVAERAAAIASARGVVAVLAETRVERGGDRFDMTHRSMVAMSCKPSFSFYITVIVCDLTFVYRENAMGMTVKEE